MELHLFDLDGTLLRSPHQPDGWDSEWWADPQSLEDPFVPAHPPTEMWIASTVAAARKSIANPDVLAVLATGRNDKNFRWRVPELLKSVGLHFDRVHLAPGGDVRTDAFKKSILVKYLGMYDFTKVQIWEDRVLHLPQFVKLVEDWGLPVEGHLVKDHHR